MRQLRLAKLSRHYGGLRALDAVSFVVEPGHIHGLIGPNGAGKTTLINVLSGLTPPTSGTISYGERRIDGLPPHRIAALGITRTYQHSRVFPAMTALENVLVGQHLVTRAPFWQRLIHHPAERREMAAARAEATALLAQVGLFQRRDVSAGALAYGEQRRLEIARALAARPSLLLLDEPAAGMNSVEIDQLAGIIRSLTTSGRTILLVEHNMTLVMSICDRLTVLDFGRLIVSLVGANGAGKSTTLAAISGLVPPRGGRVLFNGEELTRLRSDQIVQRGVVQVAEGRAILGGLSVVENLELGGYHRRDRVALRAEMASMMERFPILGRRRHAPAGSLSGGEQQMLAIARGLLARPRLFLLDEPSMGLAPQLVSEVFRIIDEIHTSGTTILLVEQNARRALAISDQAHVLETGRIVLSGPGPALLGDQATLDAYLGSGIRRRDDRSTFVTTE